VIIMIGATVITPMLMDAALALIPLVLGVLAAFVAYGRWRLVPLRGRRSNETGQRQQAMSNGGRLGTSGT
jgi:hypothetical protein